MKLKARRLPDRYNDDTIGINIELDPEMLRRLKIEMDSQTFDTTKPKSSLWWLLDDVIFEASKPKRLI